MNRLIKNEFKKLFSKKLMYILLIITIGAVILTKVLYSIDVVNMAEKQYLESQLTYLEEEMKKSEYKLPENKETLISLQVEYEKIKLELNYDMDSWQYDYIDREETVYDLIRNVNKYNGDEVQITYVRKENETTTNIKPIQTLTNDYKLGLWVRDAAAGVGTATFYEPSTKMFTALGHGITDIDTGEIVKIANGELTTSSIISIKKGEKGSPGEIRGTIDAGSKIGDVAKNGAFGISGVVTNIENLNLNSMQEMEVALRSEIKEGKAFIICELENGKKEQYEIEIERIYVSNNYDNKSMLIRITDKRLLEKTGGIIQGMSGSPIIQNGRFVGAVTHVLVNNPTQGYAVFADMMIKQMREVE